MKKKTNLEMTLCFWKGTLNLFFLKKMKQIYISDTQWVSIANLL